MSAISIYKFCFIFVNQGIFNYLCIREFYILLINTNYQGFIIIFCNKNYENKKNLCIYVFKPIESAQNVIYVTNKK